MPNVKRAQSIVGYNNDGGRPENDFYPTPPDVTRCLLDRELFGDDVWEPACGDGAMSRVLESYGHKRVVSTDIEPRGYGDQLDFLKTSSLLAPYVITNPPYRIAEQFAHHALQLGAVKVALLCKLAFLEGQERKKWLKTSPLKVVYVFSKRISLYREGVKLKNGGMIAFAWFVWYSSHDRVRPVIDWI